MFILHPGSSFAVVFRKDGIPCRYMEQKKSIQIDNSFKIFFIIKQKALTERCHQNCKKVKISFFTYRSIFRKLFIWFRVMVDPGNPGHEAGMYTCALLHTLSHL